MSERAYNKILAVGSRIQIGLVIGEKVDVVLGASPSKRCASENLLTGSRTTAAITVGIEPSCGSGTDGRSSGCTNSKY